MQCVKLAELCERTLRNCRRNADESLVKKLNRVRDRNENLWQRIRTDNIEEKGEPLSYTRNLMVARWRLCLPLSLHEKRGLNICVLWRGVWLATPEEPWYNKWPSRLWLTDHTFYACLQSVIVLCLLSVLYQSHIHVCQIEQQVGHLIKKGIKLLFMKQPTATSADIQFYYFILASVVRGGEGR